MKNSLFKKLIFAMIIIGIMPMIVFSFLTITSYQELINKSMADNLIDQSALNNTELNFKNIQIQTMLVFVLVSVFIIFFSIILARNFIYPIKKLIKGVEELKKGSLKNKIVLKTNDEFEFLANIFNEMAETLEQKVNDLERSEKEAHKAYADLTLVERNLENEHKKTAAVISNFIDPIIVIDQNNKINFFNPTAKEIFDLDQADLGKTVDSKHNFSLENFKEIIKAEYKTKTEKVTTKSFCTFEEEMIVKNKQQELSYKVITAPVVTEQEEKLGVMKIFYNLTKEKMLDKMKSDFISIAAHQLRTPLAAIKWCIKLVLDEDEGKINEGQRDVLTKGYVSNERVIELVNDMLNVSRIEDNRLIYSFNEEDINNALQIVLSSLEKIIQDKKIELIVNRDETLPLVLMDKDKMILVLQNLLENAVKYTPENGKIEVFITADKNKLNVRIKDNGVGIPKDDQKKLFTKFFRAGNVIRIQTEGSGLGLFICKNIIESHGGKISFKSEEGLGSEFVFHIPVSDKPIKSKK
jgi:two-component system, NtrC family, sensor histidine kinase KinB